MTADDIAPNPYLDAVFDYLYLAGRLSALYDIVNEAEVEKESEDEEKDDTATEKKFPQVILF